MRIDIYQTLAALIALGLVAWSMRQENFQDAVIPPLLSTRDASAELLANFQAEYRNYVLPVADAIEKLLELRPSAPVDRSVVQIRDQIRDINRSSQPAINKLLLSFDTLPANVEIYANTYKSLINIAGAEYERSLQNIISPLNITDTFKYTPRLNLDQLRRNPQKTVNKYWHISNTRAEILAEEAPKVRALAADFEIAAARLRILLAQSK